MIQAATSGSLAKLGHFLRAHPENLLPNDNQIEDKVYYQHLAIPHVISTFVGFIYFTK